MTSVTLSVPGKTFLVGEYLALDGGPSLILSTAPRFELKVRSLETGEAFRLPFASASPAGLYFQKHAARFRGLALEFRDPHAGLGGLGASSAQFVLLYLYVNDIRSIVSRDFDWARLLHEYREVAWNGEGTPPSGADVVSQACGGVTWFDGRSNEARKLSWNFKSLDFTLLRTGVKLATHEHLRQHKAAPQEALRGVVAQATKAVEQSDEDSLCAAVHVFADLLAESGWAADGTKSLLRELSDLPAVRAAKGCGAMGADIILVLHDSKDAALIRSWADERGLRVAGTSRDLTAGFARND